VIYGYHRILIFDNNYGYTKGCSLSFSSSGNGSDLTGKIVHGMINSYHKGGIKMATAVKKTISLPPDLAEEIELTAKEEGKTLSAVVQDALRITRKERLKKEFYQIQGYWSRKAKEKGVLNEKDLEKYLKK
jgi:hypothetical protein